jgi:hypothetical protein
MNRRKLPGVASATKRLADGTLRRYYYAWRGGPLLKGEDGAPSQPGDPAFHVAYTAAHAARRKPATGTLFSLIATFRTSSEFTGIRSEKTKKDHRRYLKMIEDEFGINRGRGKFQECSAGKCHHGCVSRLKPTQHAVAFSVMMPQADEPSPNRVV